MDEPQLKESPCKSRLMKIQNGKTAAKLVESDIPKIIAPWNSNYMPLSILISQCTYTRNYQHPPVFQDGE